MRGGARGGTRGRWGCQVGYHWLEPIIGESCLTLHCTNVLRASLCALRLCTDVRTMVMHLPLSFEPLVSSLTTRSVKLIIPVLLGTIFFRCFKGSHSKSCGSPSSSSTIRSAIAPCIPTSAPSGSISSTSMLSSEA